MALFNRPKNPKLWSDRTSQTMARQKQTQTQVPEYKPREVAQWGRNETGIWTERSAEDDYGKEATREREQGCFHRALPAFYFQLWLSFIKTPLEWCSERSEKRSRTEKPYRKCRQWQIPHLSSGLRESCSLVQLLLLLLISGCRASHLLPSSSPTSGTFTEVGLILTKEFSNNISLGSTLLSVEKYQDAHSEESEHCTGAGVDCLSEY